ncbi:TPA: hydantoinase/oxoprolinase family protein [bacterium]|nr:hydantoinase/oxoprolinase family protein [bacterium]
MRLGLGIDTGGTYTDSVIIDFETGKVIKKAKALTTRYDLSVGIADSIDNLGDFDPSEIRLVSASTTLATNSIVEGKGARACLLGIGYDRDTLYNYGLKDSFPIKVVKLINGGHDIQGYQIHPLDISALKEAILDTKDIVDAYGVSAYGGVRNPEHEIKAKEMIKEMTGLPVICGHDLTSNLNSIRRAITVAFNARLVPVIRELLTSIKVVLHKRGIDAPLMVVKGDGHIVSDELAMERPVETVLSGPAASITGGSNLSGVDTGIVVDMGGTTTDIAIIRNGIPNVKIDGAIVGGWRTSIRAADIQTSGLGGDSHITLDRSGKVTLSPQRVIPICLASAKYKEILPELRQLALREWTSYLVGPTDFLIRMKNSNHYAMNENEKSIYNALGEKPMSSYSLAVKLGLLHPALLNTIALEEHGIIGRIGFTPTDLLHAEGTYSVWDVESARLATEIYARHSEMEFKDFIAYVKNEVIDKLSTEIFSKLITDEIDDFVSFDSKVSSLLLHKILGKKIMSDVDVKTSVKMPIIAIGAPVTAYFPAVASQLGAELIVPEHAEVANAIGAITGSIIEAVEVLIDPIYSPAGLVCYTVHTPEEKVDLPDLTSATAFAERTAKRLAKEKAIRAGAGKQIDVKIQRADEIAKPAQGYGEAGFLLSSHIKAIAIGKPDIIS